MCVTSSSRMPQKTAWSPRARCQRIKQEEGSLAQRITVGDAQDAFGAGLSYHPKQSHASYMGYLGVAKVAITPLTHGNQNGRHEPRSLSPRDGEYFEPAVCVAELVSHGKIAKVICPACRLQECLVLSRGHSKDIRDDVSPDRWGVCLEGKLCNVVQETFGETLWPVDEVALAGVTHL